MKTEKQIRDRLLGLKALTDKNSSDWMDFNISLEKQKRLLIKQEILEWVLDDEKEEKKK